MCGIVAELRFGDSAGATPDEFARLVALMARRGPDAAGTWESGPCRLGFRRLAILDLSPAGNQPMVGGDGRCALVYNGELYNYRELRRELIQQGVQFRSSGDSEVMLHALMRWGAEGLARCNGMYALAFYDAGAQSLLLARDHAGIKPLYYALTGQGLLCASQYDQLLAHPWRRGLAVDAQALGLYLRLGYIPAPYALLEQTHMLEAGAWLRVDSAGQREHGRTFRFPVYRTPDLRGPEAEEAVAAAVANAVQRQMVSDVPLGAFLSGGIDSPLVTAEMQAHSAQPIQAFTIGSHGSEFDETADAARYAQALGVQHIIQHASAQDALGLLDDVIAACGEPFADYSIFPTLLAARLARRQVTVMLSGDGGDELFWGYARRCGSVLRSAGDFQQPYWQRSARRAATRLTGRGRGHANLRWPSLGDWYRAKHTRMPETWLRQLFPTLPAWPQAFDLYDYRGAQADATAQWLRWNEFTGHLTMVLLKVDRASMYNSLEVRVPLLDREVIDVAARVDWRACLDLQRMQGKLPLRRALAAHVPAQTQEKRGFAVPMDAWLREALRPLCADMLLGRRELLGRPLRPEALGRLWRRHQSGAEDFGWGLWLLLSLALWEARYHA